MKPEDIHRVKEEALAEAEAADSPQALESVRIRFLGSKGRLKEIMKGLKDAAPGDKPIIGQASNELKNALQEVIARRKAELDAGAQEQLAAAFDPTLPGRWPKRGTHHPVHQIMDRAVDIFRNIGFTVAEGPDIETVRNNFDALNTPADHPSRDPNDTFYFEDGSLLRTHTSPVQVRYMESHPPPVRIVAPGRCYRRDDEDPTHTANFHQVEGLYVSDRVSLADLKGDLTYFAHQMMAADTEVRFRPHFFPFTEPSVEVDFSCHVCRGERECKVCKSSGWIEIAGAGMVDPNVLSAVGYDPEQVTGYAFGMGIERIAMILYDLDDIRRLYQSHVPFLEQF